MRSTVNLVAENEVSLATQTAPLATHGIAHSTRMSHIRNSSPPTFHPDILHPEFFPPPFHPDVSPSEFFSADIPPGYLTSGILSHRHSIRISCIRNSPRRHFTRISHIRNSSSPTFHPDVLHPKFSPPTFHLDVSQPQFYPTDIPLYPDVSQPNFYPDDIPLFPDITHPEFCPADVPPSPDISHPELCSDPLDSALWITAQVRIHIRSGHFLYACLNSHMCMITLSIH